MIAGVGCSHVAARPGPRNVCRMPPARVVPCRCRLPLLLLVLVSCWAGSPRADDLPAPVDQSAHEPRFSFKGSEFCIRCHRSEQGEWSDTATTAAWRYDAHSRSHLALLPENPRTRAIEAALRIRAADTASCVACHTHPAAEPAAEEETPLVHAGISCETCHGAGSAYFEPHLEKRWRFLSPAEKQALGMHDLRSPAQKAENCLSCHLGDVASGRVVSHAMYAAGHPPLPAFEMEAYSRALEPHWKRVWEKSPRVQADAARAGYHTETASVSQRALIGALVGLRESVEQVVDYAAASTGPLPAGRSWPELALYDCQACHHELQLPSWRQRAGYGDLVPGRPSLVRWPRELAAVACAEAGQPTDIDALLAPWVQELNRRPFGVASRLTEVSRAPLDQIGRAIDALAARPRDASLAEIERLRIQKLAAAGRRSTDFESARLLGWVLVETLSDHAGWPPETKARIVAQLTEPLALQFPATGPNQPAAQPPFWQTSLTAAARADRESVQGAFQVPEQAASPAGAPPAHDHGSGTPGAGR